MNIQIKKETVPLQKRVEALQTVKFGLAGLWILVAFSLVLAVLPWHSRGHVNAVSLVVAGILLALALLVSWLYAKASRSIQEALRRESEQGS